MDSDFSSDFVAIRAEELLAAEGVSAFEFDFACICKSSSLTALRTPPVVSAKVS